MLTFYFSCADGKMTVQETLTSGMVGQRVKLTFSSEWDHLLKTAVFRAGDVTRIVTNVEDEVVIPSKVLEKPLKQLFVGVYGVSADGSVVIPTIRAAGPQILPGVDPSAEPGTDPDLPVWVQLQTEISNVNERINVNAETVMTEINQQKKDLDKEIANGLKKDLFSGLVVPSGARSIQFTKNAGTNQVTVTLGSSMNVFYVIDGVVYNTYVTPAVLEYVVPNNHWLVFDATASAFAVMSVAQINASDHILLGCFTQQYTSVKGDWFKYYLQDQMDTLQQRNAADIRKKDLFNGIVVPSSSRKVGFSLNAATNEVTVTLGTSMNAYYVIDGAVYSTYVTPTTLQYKVPNGYWFVFDVTDTSFKAMQISEITASPHRLIGCFANQYTAIKGDWFQYYLQNQIDTVENRLETMTEAEGYLTVSPNGAGDYRTIQAAVQAASDGDTILIFPGTYVEQVAAWGKTVHLVGMNRETCILMDHSSHYDTPPLEISSGSVRNMTIIEDHASPNAALLTGDDTDGCAWAYERAYSIHVEDYLAAGKDLLIANCKIINTKRAALGMGTYTGQHITVRDCEIWSGIPTRTVDVKRGAVYFHNYSLTGVQNAVNQRITLINNDISCDDEIAMCILDAHEEGIQSQLTVDAINNCVYSAVHNQNNAAVQLKSGALTNNYVKLSGKSYGNSVAILNA